MEGKGKMGCGAKMNCHVMLSCGFGYCSTWRTLIEENIRDFFFGGGLGG